jgi:predicted RNase H-like HicB family nuclease
MESKYQIIVRWSDEDGAYIAEVPELPGCMADGQTRQEAVVNVELAIQQWIESANELGRPIPEHKSMSPRRPGAAIGVLKIMEDDDSHLEDFKECRRNKHDRTKKRKPLFVPERDAIEEFRPERLRDFVDYWSQFYQYSVRHADSPGRIDYYQELNIRDSLLCDLTEENIQRLLRWKYPHTLTHVILNDLDQGKKNLRVTRVLNRLDDINRFRRGEITEREIRDVADSIFSRGVVFRAFLLHIAKPHIHPIVDQHVFRAYQLRAKKPMNREPNSWSDYDEYTSYFHKIADVLAIERMPSNIEAIKKIDNALWALGKFRRR